MKYLTYFARMLVEFFELGDSNFPQSFSLYGRHVKFGVYLNEFYSKLDKNQASREKIVFKH